MNIFVLIGLWAPVVVWAGLIYFLSSIPSLNSGLGIWDTVLRKGAHVFEYTVLTALLWRAARRSWRGWSWNQVASFVVGVAVMYAASDEIHQSFVPGRGPSVRDVLIDCIGITLAILVVKRMKIYE